MARDLTLDDDVIGWVPALNQAGYTLAILLISPLGDVVPRRRLIDLLSVVLVLGSLLAASSGSLLAGGFVLASLVANNPGAVSPAPATAEAD